MLSSFIRQFTFLEHNIIPFYYEIKRLYTADEFVFIFKMYQRMGSDRQECIVQFHIRKEFSSYISTEVLIHIMNNTIEDHR